MDVAPLAANALIPELFSELKISCSFFQTPVMI